MNCVRCKKRLTSIESFIDHVRTEHNVFLSQSPIESPFDASPNIRKSLSKPNIIAKPPNLKGD
jgi:hypothetical protein